MLLMYPVTSFHTCYGNFKCASGQTLPSLVLLWRDRNCNREAFLRLKRRTKGKKKLRVRIRSSVYLQIHETVLYMYEKFHFVYVQDLSVLLYLGCIHLKTILIICSL